MRAHVLSIGSELLLGHLTDTNATFLAQELAGHGIELLHVTQVGDDRGRIAATIRAALADANVVVCTGGVGPTDDDLTREAIADVVGQTPEIDLALLAHVRTFFAGRGIAMPDRNAKQAWLIPAAEPLPNPVGTAPGWFVRHDDRLIAAMPGVPREMFRMWTEQVRPRLASRLPDRVISSVTVKTIGIGESAAEQMLDDLVKIPNPTVATYAKDDGVHVRITAIADNGTSAVAARDATAAQVRHRLDRFIYGEDDTSLAAAVARRLAGHDLTLGIVEQGTAGRVGALLLGDPECVPLVVGSLALSAAGDLAAPAAGQLARDAQKRFGTSLGLGVVATMNRGDDGPPSGAVTIAISGARTVEESSPFRMPLAEIQRRSALVAAEVLLRATSAPA